MVLPDAGLKVYRGTSLVRTPPPQDPSVALCLGIYRDPMGVGVSYERGTPVLSLGRARLGGYQARLGAMGQSNSWNGDQPHTPILMALQNGTLLGLFRPRGYLKPVSFQS